MRRGLSVRKAFLWLTLLSGCNSSSGGADGGLVDDALPQTDATIEPVELPAFEPPESNVIIGRVTTPTGVPVVDATVMVEGGASATTNYDGFYFVPVATPLERAVVRFERPGYMQATRVVRVHEGGKVSLNALLLPQVAAVPLESGPSFLRSGTVELSAAAVVDEAGNAVEGPVEVSMTPIDVRSPAIIAAPGDFSAIRADGAEGQLETFAMADFQLRDSEGRPLQIKEGERARIEMLLPADTTLVAGDVVPAWHFDEVTGKWVEEGTGVVQAYSQDQARLAFITEVGHFSTWNCDRTMETTCVSGVVKLCDGSPAPGADLLAEGIDYDGNTQSFVGEDGRFCLPVKTNSVVSVAAASGYGPDRLVVVSQVTSGSAPSSCPGPCTEVELTLPCTPEESGLDCDDTYFAGCRACVSGRIVDESGKPVPAVIEVASGRSHLTVATDARGHYCAPAAEGTLALISATGPNGAVGTVSITPDRTGRCPDCVTAPDLVLSASNNPTGEDELDFSHCPEMVGGLTIDSVRSNGASSAFEEINTGWISVGLNAEAGQYRLVANVDLVKSSSSGIRGVPIITFGLDSDQPVEAGTYQLDDEVISTNGNGYSNMGGIVGLGNETYTISKESGATGSITFDGGFGALGDPVKGHFEITFASDCGPEGASVTVKGTIDTVVKTTASIYPDTSNLESVQEWMCWLFDLMLLSPMMDAPQGVVQATLDGLPYEATTNIVMPSTFSRENDELRISLFSDDGMMSVNAIGVQPGSNPISGGSLSVDGESCYYNGVGIVELEDLGSESTWMTGRFEVEYTPSEFNDPSAQCRTHQASGQFGIPACR